MSVISPKTVQVRESSPEVSEYCRFATTHLKFVRGP